MCPLPAIAGESRGRDADHGQRSTVQADFPADDIGICAEAVAPHLFAHHRDRARSRRGALIGLEQAPIFAFRQVVDREIIAGD